MSKAQFEDRKALNHTSTFMITCMTQNREPPPARRGGGGAERKAGAADARSTAIRAGLPSYYPPKNTLSSMYLSSTLSFFTSSSCVSDTSLAGFLYLLSDLRGLCLTHWNYPYLTWLCWCLNLCTFNFQAIFPCPLWDYPSFLLPSFFSVGL